MKLAEQKLTVEYIINTHGHFDHVGANRKLKEATGARLVIHALDQSMLEVLSETSAAFGLSVENSPPPDQTVQDGDTLHFGEITLTVLHTPGHTPGGISLHTDGVVFVGDTLFAGSIGRTDFPGGDFDTLISSIRNKLYPLGDRVIVYTGHGPETTIGREKRFNPFASM
jgi:glyoxylase-like metal-dependent hydrolase (beta-lactamase superfamily II)